MLCPSAAAYVLQLPWLRFAEVVDRCKFTLSDYTTLLIRLHISDFRYPQQSQAHGQSMAWAAKQPTKVDAHTLYLVSAGASGASPSYATVNGWRWWVGRTGTSARCMYTIGLARMFLATEVWFNAERGTYFRAAVHQSSDSYEVTPRT